MKRQLVAPAIYKHFKHTEDGEVNNYLYCTMGASKPVSFKELKEMFGGSVLYNALLEARHTELKRGIHIFSKAGQLYHNENDERSNLVIDKSLYDNTSAYARPLDMFLSEVEQEKYPDVKQKYRFELYVQDEPIGDLVYPPNTEL